MTQPQTIIVKQRGGCLDAVIFLVVACVLVFGGCTYCATQIGKEAIREADEIKDREAREKAESEAKE